MPKISEQEWMALFKAADKDHSGQLDKHELVKIMKHAHAQVSDATIEKYFELSTQPGGTQTASFEQFVKGMKALEEFLSTMTAFFHKFDVNKNGYLEKKEFRKALEFTGRNYDDREFEAIFQTTDVNKKGQISLDNFLATMLQ